MVFQILRFYLFDQSATLIGLLPFRTISEQQSDRYHTHLCKKADFHWNVDQSHKQQQQCTKMAPSAAQFITDWLSLRISSRAERVQTSVGPVTRAPRVYPRVSVTGMSYTLAERRNFYPTGIPYRGFSRVEITLP